MFIDSHAHLNFKEFGKEISGAIKKAGDAGVKVIINVGSSFSTSLKATQIARGYGDNADQRGIKMYSSVGIHPIHLVKDIEEKAVFDGREYSFKTKQEDFDYGKFKKLALSSNKIIAIGETGIDLFRIADQNHPIDKVVKLQSEVFLEHIKLAKELKLPLIIHGRGTKEGSYGAYDLILKILKTKMSTYEVDIGGVAHCFAGNLKQAKEFVKMGFYIGFTGIVTFKNAAEIQQIAREIPLEKILIETDCPFLAPVPYRGKRNEPAFVVEVAKKIAELKNISLEKVEKQTTENTRKLFGI